MVEGGRKLEKVGEGGRKVGEGARERWEKVGEGWRGLEKAGES